MCMCMYICICMYIYIGVNVLRWCPFFHLFGTPFQSSPYGHKDRKVKDRNDQILRFYLVFAG